MRILAISTGKVGRLVDTPERQVLSAITKSPVSTLDDPRPVELATLGFLGDEQADHRVHGGPLKAVYAYPSEHYAGWAEAHFDQHGEAPHYAWGQFGENLTVEGFVESEVYAQDRWQVGDVELEVVDNREPCFKFNIRMKQAQAMQRMLRTGHCGWYLKVNQAGVLRAGDTIQVVPGPRKISIRVLNDAVAQRQGPLL